MDNLDRKLSLESLFNSQGYKLFKEELDALIESDKIKKDNLSRSPVMDFILNYQNGHQQGLFDVKSILDSFREELEETAEER